MIAAETYVRASVDAFWIAERRWPKIPEAIRELRRLVSWWRAWAVLQTALSWNDLGASVVRVRTAELGLMVLIPCLLESMETWRRWPWPPGTETYLVSTGMVLAPLVHADWWWGELMSAVREVIG